MDYQEQYSANHIMPNFVFSLEEVQERMTILQRFIKEHMILGEDYGEIPGISKPTLLKSGAEKLCDVYGFAKKVDIVHRVEDWDKGFFHYEAKVTLINKTTDLLEAEGVGACNSMEKKYRYQDPYTLVNTVLKMAKKRAFIDAVLSATRSSGIFTQDIEDLDIVKEENSFTRLSTDKQRKYIYTLSKEKQMTEQDLKEFCQQVIGEDKPSKDWTTEEASKIIQALYQYSQQEPQMTTH
ncbi:MAG: hypothetical protein GX238_04585 [Epulopiscium sp.]|nr:hypothetical protein [Candidatus Epulonipiscium sp.]